LRRQTDLDTPSPTRAQASHFPRRGALAFGVALKRFAKRPLQNVQDWVDLGLDVLIVILHWIIDVVPLAVFGLVASIVGAQSFAPFHALGAFIVAVLVGLLV
jgi:DAACS family dicarboxylate/amino acid:cation (Na+ or H+) symporter